MSNDRYRHVHHCCREALRRPCCCILIFALLVGTGAGETPEGPLFLPQEISVCTFEDGQLFPQVISDGEGGTVVMWEDYRNGRDWDIYAQRFDAAGRRVWPAEGLPVCAERGYQRILRMVKSGDQIVVAWTDHRTPADWNVYAQALDLDGNPLWQEGGVPVCTDPAEQSNPTILADGAGGVILVWEDERRSRESQNLYLQHLDADGRPRHAEDGIPVAPAEGMQTNARLIPDGRDGFYFVWWDVVTPDAWHILAHRFRLDGTPAWSEPVRVSPAEGMQGEPQATADGKGGLLVIWQDYTNYVNDDLHAQRVNEEGKLLWPPEGVLVCGASGIQKEAVLVADGEGGLIAVWRDERDVYSDLYMQRIRHDGQRLWAEDGLPLCLAGGHQARPRLLRTSSGSFFVVWLDYREDYGDEWREAIYAQLFDQQGVQLWQEDGLPLCTNGSKQNPPLAVYADANGIGVVWSDARADVGDVFMVRIPSEQIR